MVARHIASNVKRITGAKQDNRQFIVECLRSLLGEGIPYRAYRLDIASFYESVDVSKVLESLKSSEGFSGQSASALASFFQELDRLGIEGVPRGLGLSATLAEYFLREFDETVSNLSEVWFFARFVDDIFIITSGKEVQAEFETELQDALPKGLQFNGAKQRIMTFSPFVRGQIGAQHKFSYLGYEFEISLVVRT